MEMSVFTLTREQQQIRYLMELAAVWQFEENCPEEEAYRLGGQYAQFGDSSPESADIWLALGIED